MEQPEIQGKPSKEKLPGVGTLFTETWNLYKQKVVTLITIGVMSTLALFITGAIFGLLSGIGQIEAREGFLPALFIFSITFINLIALVLITIWQSAALVIAVLRADENLGPVECYKQAWKYVFKYFLVSVIFSLFLTGGFILLVIPGIYLGIALGFAPLIIIAEEGKVTVWSSFKRSRFYVKNYWWPVFGRFVFLALVVLGFGILLGIIIYLPLSLIALASKSLAEPLQRIGGSLVDIVLTPFSFSYWILLYGYIKKIKHAAE